MPEVTKSSTVIGKCRDSFGDVLKQFKDVSIVNSWWKGTQLGIESDGGRNGRGNLHERKSGELFVPASQTPDYDDLQSRSPGNWARLIVLGLAQTCHVEGVRMPGSNDNMDVWDTWQRNGWDAKQIPLTQATIAHGMAYASALPAKDPLTGKKMARMTAHSAMKMCAFYNEDDDEWPEYAIRAVPIKNELDVDEGYYVRFYDETAVHYLSVENEGKEIADWTYISYDLHGQPVTPIVRYANSMDLHGTSTGVIEPVIPLLRRIDQDTFDRLVIQRFGAWKVRYIAGLAKPESKEQARIQAMMLRVSDILISPDSNAKFGTLEATELAGIIGANDHDLRELSAISQIPPHHLLGLSSNLQAEALTAAEAGLQRQSLDFRTFNGESHEKLFRLTASINDNATEADAYDMQLRWRDPESRSFVQTAQALAYLADSLHVPVEMLWERVPGWSDADSERATKLIKTGGVQKIIDKLAADLEVQSSNAKAEGDAAAAARSNDPDATATDPGSSAKGGGPNSKGSQPKK